MSLRGSLNDFSLPELFRLIDLGHKSGCLILQTSPDPTASEGISSYYYIWFRQGQVVAVTNRLDQQGLITLIEIKGWLSGRVAARLQSLCPIGVPLGSYLRDQEILKTKQIKSLFREQIYQIRSLFELTSGHFEMDCRATLPCCEMTGFGVRALKVALFALRTMHNWQSLTTLLPKATSALQPLRNQPNIQLEPLEWHLWEFAEGITPLGAIALQLNQPLLQIQQTALRLIIAGLVEEMPVVPVAKSSTQSNASLLPLQVSSSLTTHEQAEEPGKSRLSASFLQNLVGFLWSKV